MAESESDKSDKKVEKSESAEQSVARSFVDEVWSREKADAGSKTSVPGENSLNLPAILFTDSSRKSAKEQQNKQKDIGLAGRNSKDNEKKGTQLPDPYDKFDHANDKDKDVEDNKHSREKNSLEWRGNKISLETKDGVPSYYQDASGNSWKSKDGRAWTREGEGTVTRQGTVQFDKDSGQIREENPYGLSTSYKDDGSLTQSFKTADGREISLTKNADGSQLLNDGDKLWQSADGKNWTSGSETKQTEYKIDEFGRLSSKDSTGKEVSERQSAEAQSITQKMAKLEKQYKIKFGRPGEQIDYADSKDETHKVDLRMPTAEELKVIDEGLQKYSHVAKKNGKDFEGLQFNFISGEGKGSLITEHAWHDGGKDPSINFGPLDAARTRGWDGLEGTFLHEMAHQLQEIRWRDKEGNETVPRNVERFFGYEKVMPPHTKGEEGTYRVSDRDGKKYQYEKISEDGKETERWMPVVNGKVSNSPAEGLSDAEMRQRMPDEKRPSTDYFFHPQEAHAETIAMYLHLPERLHSVNPSLYEATKKWDQADINYRHGFTTTKDGMHVPKMMRGADGNVVANTAENRKAVREREVEWRSKAKSEQAAALPHVARRCACHA